MTIFLSIFSDFCLTAFFVKNLTFSFGNGNQLLLKSAKHNVFIWQTLFDKSCERFRDWYANLNGAFHICLCNILNFHQTKFKFHIKIPIYQNWRKIKISLLIQFLFLEFHQKTTLVKNLECPECQHPVPVTCLGGHETSDWPCAIAKSAPCGRKCGRSLACENHTCDRDCHKVKNAPNDLQSGSNCR